MKAQLEGLLDLATTLFLPRLKALGVEIEGERSVVTRTVDTDDALDESGRGRRQTVSISRTGPTRDEDTTGRFRVWTRGLGGASDPEWADRIRGAVRHLPNKWPGVDRAEVGVAVREGLESAEGRFVIFLPTEMATGTGAHINAPFFDSLDRRRIDFSDEYNTLLLGCVADLCLDAVGDLLAGGNPRTSAGWRESTSLGRGARWEAPVKACWSWRVSGQPPVTRRSRTAPWCCAMTAGRAQRR